MNNNNSISVSSRTDELAHSSRQSLDHSAVVAIAKSNAASSSSTHVATSSINASTSPRDHNHPTTNANDLASTTTTMKEAQQSCSNIQATLATPSANSVNSNANPNPNSNSNANPLTFSNPTTPTKKKTPLPTITLSENALVSTHVHNPVSGNNATTTTTTTTTTIGGESKARSSGATVTPPFGVSPRSPRVLSPRPVRT
jgi:hypothetical protein